MMQNEEKMHLIYFYDTRPNNDQVVFLEEYIKISKLKYTKKTNILTISLSYTKEINGKEEIIPVNSNTTTLLLDVDGDERYTSVKL